MKRLKTQAQIPSSIIKFSRVKSDMNFQTTRLQISNKSLKNTLFPCLKNMLFFKYSFLLITNLLNQVQVSYLNSNLIK